MVNAWSDGCSFPDQRCPEPDICATIYTMWAEKCHSDGIQMSTTDEKWLLRNLDGDFHASGLMTLCLSSSNPARPNIWPFSIFSRFT